MAITVPPKLAEKPLAPAKLLLLIAAVERKYKLYSLLNFDEMAAQSDYEFSANTLEHTFREFKREAQKLNREKSVTGQIIESGSRPKKRKSTKFDGAEDDEEIDESRGTKKARGFDKEAFVEDCVNAGEDEDEEEVAV